MLNLISDIFVKLGFKSPKSEKSAEEKKAVKKISREKLITILIICAVIFLFAAICLISFVATKNNKSVLKLGGVSIEEELKVEPLTALNKISKKAFIKNKGAVCFKFNENQKNFFVKTYESKDSAALTLRILVCPDEEESKLLTSSEMLRIGFLTKSDFDSKGKLIERNYGTGSKIVIQAQENQLLVYTDGKGLIDISFALPKKEAYSTGTYFDQYVPEGFFVYSDVPCKITEAYVTPASLGFDVSQEVPFFSFSNNGGIIDMANSGFDFTGATSLFSAKNSIEKLMPEYEIIFSDDENFKGTAEEPVKIEIKIGSEKIKLNNVKAAQKVSIPCGALKNPYGEFQTLSNKDAVKAVLLKSVAKFKEGNKIEGVKNYVTTPIQTDPGLILHYPVSSWRVPEYELFKWDRFDNILFFDTKNYDIQDRFFRRMAYFVEKKGYKGKLISDEELQGKHGYNAHDYSASSMANFFNKAVDEDFKLLPEELVLKEILIANGLFETDGNKVIANEGGLVSISQETLPGTRYNLLAHEGWHTLFFQDQDFRNYVSAVYYTMDPDTRDFLIDYFKSQPSLGYDTDDEYLMHNEFMAYIMQSPLSGVAEYFVNHANWNSVVKYTPKLAAYVRKTNGRGFEDAAIALNNFVYDKYGVVAGNIGIVSK